MSGSGELRARKALVTGSSSGIGAAVTNSLLERGVTVVGVARDHTRFQPDSGTYLPIALDLADLDATIDGLDAIASQHGDIDTVISNAGSGRIAELEQISAAQVRRDIDLNLTSHLLVARTFVPRMKRRGHGDLIVTGSASGRRGGRKGSVYSAAKFGLRGMAESLREECSRTAVRVTLVSPGPVRTPFFDALDYHPEDGADFALSAEDVAAVMLQVLEAPAHVVFREIDLGSRSHNMRRRGTPTA